MAEVAFGIVANVAETDKFLRLGAKAWLLSGWSGGGFERVTVAAISRGGGYVEKWVPISRLTNFRAAWMPESIRERAGFFCAKTKEEAAASASELATLAEKQRAEHQNRFVGHSVP